MRKVGWVLIILLIVGFLLPVWPYGNYNTWFLFAVLHEILGGDFLYGIGSLLGFILFFGFGIWLVNKKKVKGTKN